MSGKHNLFLKFDFYFHSNDQILTYVKINVLTKVKLTQFFLKIKILNLSFFGSQTSFFREKKRKINKYYVDKIKPKLG
jgi:hypothetical protein